MRNTSGNIAVATTVNPRFDHLSGIEALRGAVTVTHRCQSLSELIGVARNGLVDVIIVADEIDQVGLNFLDAIEAHSDRCVKVGIITDQATERERLKSMGVPTISSEVSATDLVEWLVEIASGQYLGVPSSLEVRQTYDEQSDVLPVEDVRTAEEALPCEFAIDDADASSHSLSDNYDDRYPDQLDKNFTGNITALWGPIGSPGRTVLAVNLAVEVALAGQRTLLIDLDTYGTSVGAHLGLMEESAGIAVACRRADQGVLDLSLLKKIVSPVKVAGTHLDVLSGLTRPDRWPEIRTANLAEVLRIARNGWDQIILDCGFGLEEDEELSFDIPAPQRNASTLAGLQAAQRILAIGTGDPIGLPRLIRGCDDLERIQPPARISIIINKVSAVSSGVSPESQIRLVWERHGPARSIHSFIRADQRVAANAVFSGQVLAESAPKSGIRRDITRLMHLLDVRAEMPSEEIAKHSRFRKPPGRRSPKTTSAVTQMRSRFRSDNSSQPAEPEHHRAGPAHSSEEKSRTEIRGGRARRRHDQREKFIASLNPFRGK